MLTAYIVRYRHRGWAHQNVAINFVTPADERIVFDIQRFCDGRMNKLYPPIQHLNSWWAVMFRNVPKSLYTGSYWLQGSLMFALRLNVTVSCDMWSLVS